MNLLRRLATAALVALIFTSLAAPMAHAADTLWNGATSATWGQVTHGTQHSYH